MITRFVSDADLAALTAELVAAGTRVIAPVRDPADPARADYRPVARLEEADLSAPLPRRSLKEAFLPATEVLLRYRQHKQTVELAEVPTAFPPAVILGARPCDAAGVEVLDRVMGWDLQDELWFGRRAATTLVARACPGEDASCFCTAVGGGPEGTRGADVVLVPADGGHLALAATAKGEAFLAAHPARFADAGGRDGAAALAAFGAPARARAEQALPALPAGFGQALAGAFDHAAWKGIALRCHGCGACTAVCPTCHCFDIVDEHDGHDHGARRRSWDFCQTAKFTLHASGHNPRPTQTERYRQRVMHKFSIYPARFDAVLCTGCGRCSRTCSAGMDLPEILGQLVAAVGRAGADERGDAR